MPLWIIIYLYKYYPFLVKLLKGKKSCFVPVCIFKTQEHCLDTMYTISKLMSLFCEAVRLTKSCGHVSRGGILFSCVIGFILNGMLFTSKNIQEV